jgi:hypothetical protein
VSKPSDHTPEQDAVLTEGYPRGLSRAELTAAVNALPGKRIEKEHQFWSAVSRLGLQRPAGWRSVAQEAAVATRKANKVAPRRKEASPRPILLRQLINIGMQLGVPLARRTIDVVNRAQKREDPTHPGYVLVQKQTGWRM